jgi:hypothetical protein
VTATEGLRGSDGLTPTERLQARGYDFDKKGRSIMHGYVGKHLDFETEPWRYFDNRRPDCTLRCETSRKPIGRAWRGPEGIVWLRDEYRQQPLGQTAEPNILVKCPVHGLVQVGMQWVIDETRSNRRQATVRCTNM